MALPTLDDARALDAADTLRHHRAAFALPPELIYLDGNSLGPLAHEAASRLHSTIHTEWGNRLIRGWTESGWMEAPARIGARIAPIIGAAPAEVIVADSTSVNLFKLLLAALRLRPGRHEILLEAANFPTDRHAADGIAALLPRITIRTAAAQDLAAAIGPNTAVVLLCHVHYRTGARLDMARLNQAAHAAGALTLWDLSHSAGAIPVDLAGTGADLAVGCGYKFLNGGPGAPAFLYVASALQAEARNPIQGWIGHATPFAFDDIYAPAPGLPRFLSGTPGILGLAALEAGIDTWRTANPAQLWAKSARMFDLFAALAAAWCPALHLLTPQNQADRGSQISFRHPNAAALMQTLLAGGVIGDHRPPDILRFGLTPLYTSFEEIWRAANALRQAVNPHA